MISIGKPICGITLNGNKYALDADGNIRTFRNASAAFRFLHRHGISRQDAEDMEISFGQIHTEDNAGGG